MFSEKRKKGEGTAKMTIRVSWGGLWCRRTRGGGGVNTVVVRQKNLGCHLGWRGGDGEKKNPSEWEEKKKKTEKCSVMKT